MPAGEKDQGFLARKMLEQMMGAHFLNRLRLIRKRAHVRFEIDFRLPDGMSFRRHIDIYIPFKIFFLAAKVEFHEFLMPISFIIFLNRASYVCSFIVRKNPACAIASRSLSCRR